MTGYATGTGGIRRNLTDMNDQARFGKHVETSIVCDFEQSYAIGIANYLEYRCCAMVEAGCFTVTSN